MLWLSDLCSGAEIRGENDDVVKNSVKVLTACLGRNLTLAVDRTAICSGLRAGSARAGVIEPADSELVIGS